MNSNQLTALHTRARKSKEYVYIEGFHALKHSIRFGADLVSYVTDDKSLCMDLAQKLAPDIAKEIERVTEIETSVFSTLSPRIPRTRILAIAQRPARDIPNAGKLVLLDNPRDLGNVGTIIRTSAAAGIDAVLITGAIDPWHPTVVLSAAGLQFALPCIQIELNQLPSLPIITFDERGDDLKDFTPQQNQILAFGSERDGISPGLLRRSTEQYRIPMQNGVSSLNLSASVAIITYTTP